MFYFAIPHNASLESRAAAPRHIADTFGLTGAIEFVREEPDFRLYRLPDTRG
jgi:hypothetical protein